MTDRILLFGNSGSGKSTLAKHLCAEHALAHLDLDTLAWQDTTPPERRPVGESEKDIQGFTAKHDRWVIEGCYTDLLELVASRADEAIWLNLPVEACVENARARPWEPHKYPSKEAQDANLGMLIDWIRAYERRDDTFSKTAHRALFEGFTGRRREIHENTRR